MDQQALARLSASLMRLRDTAAADTSTALSAELSIQISEWLTRLAAEDVVEYLCDAVSSYM